MRPWAICAALVAAVLLGAPNMSQAYEGPWCAIVNIGGSTEAWNCSVRSFDACRREVIAGNHGSCSPNPRWTGDRRQGNAVHRRGY